MQIAAAVLFLLPIPHHRLLNFGTFTLLNVAPLIYISYPHRTVCCEMWEIIERHSIINISSPRSYICWRLTCCDTKRVSLTVREKKKIVNKLTHFFLLIDSLDTPHEMKLKSEAEYD